MSLESMRNVWEILEHHQVDIDAVLHEDVACSICRRVLINAQIGPCGCRYCLKCITRCLDEGERTCSGGTDECGSEQLTIGENVMPDQAANIRLSKIVVKCPEKNCEYKGELRTIRTHIRACDSRSVNCPLFTIGCSESCSGIASIGQHIHENVVSHFTLLLESIDNLKNETELLKRDVVGLREENDDLKEDIRTMRADQALMEARTLETENNNLLKNEELEELKRKYNEIENRLREIKERSDSAATFAEVPASDTKLEITTNTDDYQTLCTKIINLETKQEQQNCDEIIWIIDDWRDMLLQGVSGVNKWFYSDPFYSHRNGYKMCLAANPYGYGTYVGTHLSFGFCLMKGSFDDILSWPFKGSVFIELIDRSSRIYKTTTMRFNPSDPDYNKPTKERSNEIFYYDFCQLKQILNDDKLFVRCKVKF